MVKVDKTVNDKVFDKMAKVDRTVNDLCCIVRCSRSSLHVFAPDKGLVVGIHFVYKHGSRKLAIDSETLVTPDMKWIGVIPVDKLKLEEQVIAELTDSNEGRLDRL
ncbi:hypothetical protein Vadar_006943 [Vaccinium darrowii]|uniref:Uncharacterized protein n=1 Tax=Vaccinium darrowii TaxID=229202 RepID=A0ACB7YTY4_9ERIC|nr:hypothetical protein Vadar_006943 [Vaccinium darrowii]